MLIHAAKCARWYAAIEMRAATPRPQMRVRSGGTSSRGQTCPPEGARPERASSSTPPRYRQSAHLFQVYGGLLMFCRKVFFR